ncbi:hypothetical protein INT45_009202 [Circinella minor]|uniref:F-box domain-containing protein n=1 Tax=Circinella minor TaxID=1195481 RepID=A0A8H7VMI4_9FUNG|nr:hypothetical protein INT45_009202 [Circinella minor]
MEKSTTIISSYLYQLPPELIQQIVHYLPKYSLAQLCLTTQRLYEICLPVLYTHLELSFRCHIHQLEMALQHRPFLRDIVRRHTKHLTLICRQSGSDMMNDFEKLLFRFLPQIHTFTFVDFHVLFTESICQLIQQQQQQQQQQQSLNNVPSIQTLEFRYCNLVSTTHNIHQLLSTMQHVRHVSMIWTDFSEMAISQLLSCLPNLKSIDFGANHNRIRTANDSALTTLTQYCFHLRHLTVSLQHIEQESLCDVLVFYGHQLTQLSIRCECPRILDVIAHFCPHIVQLTLQSTRRGGYKTNCILLLQILQKCRKLQSLELIGWLIQDIPPIVWSIVAKERRNRLRRLGWNNDISNNNNNNSIHTDDDDDKGGSWHYYLDDQAMLRQQNLNIQYRPVGNLEKTLILNSQELYEIRKSLNTK